MGFRPAHYPQIRRGIPPSGGGDQPITTPGPLLRCDYQCPGERGCLPISEAYKYGAPGSNSVHLGALDSLVSFHGTSGGRTPRSDRVMDGRTCLATQVGPGGGLLPQHAQHTSGVGGGTGSNPLHGRLSSVSRQKYGGLEVCPTILVQWDVSGG